MFAQASDKKGSPIAFAESVQSTCAYCGVGCGVEVKRAPDGQLSLAGDPVHPANGGRLCSKGSLLLDTLTSTGRLLVPQIRGQQVSWDEALAEVADGFSRVIREHGPEAVAFYVSGQMLSEDYYVANKLMKGFIGAANIDTNSRLCMASSVVAHNRAFGADIVPGCYEDLELADLIVIVGSNFSWCHPVLAQRVAQARASREKKPRVVVIDPRRTETCDDAELHLAVRSGTDAVLFSGLLHYLRQNDKLDFEFLENHTVGFSAALAAAREFSIPHVARACRVDEEKIARFYGLFARTEKTVTIFAQGIHQSSSGADKINSIINVHLATGRIGRPGQGPFSLTGQINAMGGREVGGLATSLAAHVSFQDTAGIAAVQSFWQSPRIASKPGWKAVDLFNAIDDGRVKAVWIMATNPLDSLPDAARVKEALKKCSLVVVSECFHPTDTTEVAHVLLPAAAWGEKSGTVTNSERRISRQRPFLPPPGQVKPDWWIISQVAARMGFADAFPYAGPADIFREYAALSGFQNEGRRAFNISGLSHVSDAQYESLRPVQWPVLPNPGINPVGAADAEQLGTARMFADRKFCTPDGRARMVTIHPRPPENPTDADFPFVLNTGRIRDQWHTMTRTANAPRLLRHSPEPYVEISPDDARQNGISESGFVTVETKWGQVTARAAVTERQSEGNLFIPFHWTRQLWSENPVNSVVNSVVDALSGQPEFKHTPARIRVANFSCSGFVIAREFAKWPEARYWVRVPGAGFTRFELADNWAFASWPAWARAQVGYPVGHGHGDGDWIDFVDPAACAYRAAWVRDGVLLACVFLARDPALPDRAWLESLFQKPALTLQERAFLLAGVPRLVKENA